MVTIWKFPIETTDTQWLTMPIGSEILCVQMQYGKPSLWAIVDPGRPTVSREIRIYGTGHPLPENPGTYVGTFQLDGGALVFHVFRMT